MWELVLNTDGAASPQPWPGGFGSCDRRKPGYQNHLENTSGIQTTWLNIWLSFADWKKPCR